MRRATTVTAAAMQPACRATRRDITMANQPANEPKLQYQDVPELAETFADAVGHWHFDGSTLRMEFLVNRMDQRKPSEPRAVRQRPVCRLVLTAAGTIA